MKLTLPMSALLATVFVQQVCLAAEPSTHAEAFTPESVLPNGIDSTISTNPYTGESGETRKGTVAATLNNVALLNKLLLAEPFTNTDKIEKLIIINTSLVPSLRVIGLFNMFSVDEWLASNEQPGRILTAVLYLQKYPKEITPAIRNRLLQIQKQTKIKMLSDAINLAIKGS